MNTIYTHDVIDRLETDWGKGWLSPGGEQEVSVLLENLDLSEKSVLDIGVR